MAGQVRRELRANPGSKFHRAGMTARDGLRG
jgi:hypothetical protein